MQSWWSRVDRVSRIHLCKNVLTVDPDSAQVPPMRAWLLAHGAPLQLDRPGICFKIQASLLRGSSFRLLSLSLSLAACVDTLRFALRFQEFAGGLKAITAWLWLKDGARVARRSVSWIAPRRIQASHLVKVVVRGDHTQLSLRYFAGTGTRFVPVTRRIPQTVRGKYPLHPL